MPPKDKLIQTIFNLIYMEIIEEFGGSRMEARELTLHVQKKDETLVLKVFPAATATGANVSNHIAVSFQICTCCHISAV